jgi:hypothetical protein
LALILMAPAARAEEPAASNMARLSDELRSSTLTGKLKEVDVARTAKIDQASSGGDILERRVPQVVPASLGPVGRLYAPLLNAEVKQRFHDLEVCRANVAEAQGVPVEELKADTIGLRWTILPTGRTRGTLVFEEKDTDFDLMKCVRDRMTAWQFTGSKAGPVEVVYSYTFIPMPRPAPAAETDEEENEI